MKDTFSEWLSNFSNAQTNRCESLCNRFSTELEDDLLNYEVFPKTHLEFILQLLSNNEYKNRPGVWNFVLAAGNSMDAVTEEQLERIKRVFLENFQSYTNKDLCLAVCDFAARKMDHSTAQNILSQLKQIESEKPIELQGFADEGLFILSQEIKRSTD